MVVTYREHFTNPKALCVVATEGEIIVGVANAERDGDTIILAFIGVRQSHQRHGIGGGLLDRLIAEGRRLGVARFVGKDTRSAASLRLMESKLGEATIRDGINPAILSKQPQRFLFLPSLDMLMVENDTELTAEWPFWLALSSD